MRKTLLDISLAAAFAAAALASSTASASSLSQFKVCGGGSCGIVKAVDDDQLAAVAGKFTIAGEVVGMSLTMASSWQAANGQRLEAAAGVSIALPGSGNPHARFHAEAGGSDPALDAQAGGGTRHVQQGRGLHSVDGVAQVIQVAGDGNGAANRAAIHVSHDPQFMAGGNGRMNASYEAANGARADIALRNNGMSMQLTMPDSGSARQHINLAGMGNIHQGIHIAADGQHVINHLQLQVQMRPATQAVIASQGLQHALNMLQAR